MERDTFTKSFEQKVDDILEDGFLGETISFEAKGDWKNGTWSAVRSTHEADGRSTWLLNAGLGLRLTPRVRDWRFEQGSDGSTWIRTQPHDRWNVAVGSTPSTEPSATGSAIRTHLITTTQLGGGAHQSWKGRAWVDWLDSHFGFGGERRFRSGFATAFDVAFDPKVAAESTAVYTIRYTPADSAFAFLWSRNLVQNTSRAAFHIPRKVESGPDLAMALFTRYRSISTPASMTLTIGARFDLPPPPLSTSSALTVLRLKADSDGAVAGSVAAFVNPTLRLTASLLARPFPSLTRQSADDRTRLPSFGLALEFVPEN